GPSAIFEALVEGLECWDLPGHCTPCELLLVGETALPVLVNAQGQVLVAASRFGRGRLLVVAHEGYLKEARLARFLCNAVSWLCPSPGAAVGIGRGLDALAEILRGAGVEVQDREELGEAPGVYCTDAYELGQPEKLVRFLKAGGGLLVGGQAWHWASQHSPDRVLFDFPGNRVTSVAGVYFTAAAADAGLLQVSKKVPNIPLTVRYAQDFTQDQKQILAGLSELDIVTGGLPSQLLVHGALAFPLGLDLTLGCFVAAAHFGRGRVVVVAHEDLLTAPRLTSLLVNAVRWLDDGRGGRVGITSGLEGLCPLLAPSGLACGPGQLDEGLSVFVCKAYSDEEASEIREFVAEGGGLLIGGQAWWWASQNPGQDAVAGYPGNHILNHFGISILGQSLTAGQFPVPQHNPGQYHFRQALAQFLGELEGQQALREGWHWKLGQDCMAFLRLPAQEVPAYASLHCILSKAVQQAGLPDVSRQHPVLNDSKEGFLLSLATELVHSGIHCSALVQGPGSGNCPPQVGPPGPPITVEIDGTNPGDVVWVSTGLYLPWGTEVSPNHPPGAQLHAHSHAPLPQVQIGCHSDDLSRARELCRAPIVIRRSCVEEQERAIPCLWGGLIYIIVPKGSKLGKVPIMIEGALPAPYFKLGETSREEWEASIRHRPAPWGELATDNIILTLPSESLRGLRDPEPLLSLWDQMMKAVATLGAVPFPFLRPERIVTDVQISAGWMHSGYPIMSHLESVQEMVSVKDMMSQGLWGPIHELGHNQQRSGWELPPHTTEATCNLWSVYVNESVLGIPRDRAHQDLKPAEREKRIRDYLKKGAPLEEWELWTALETYLQLQEAFGWEPFIALFAQYQGLDKVPWENVAKMNLWAEKFSHQVQRNLAPFFEAWGWPIQKDVAAALATLPAWEDNPMLPYLLAAN
uniref:Peptidase M60 domain-containing protein n=1 Tax=Ornithorhynchus anatinus TaxID=9258 RepID=A0A6I8N2Q0_ORNAN